MGRRKSNYVVVARTCKYALGWPRHLWEDMTPDEQEGVLVRQAALIAKMAKVNANGHKKQRSKAF